MCSIPECKPLLTNGELKPKLNGVSSLLQAPLPNPSLQVTADHNLKRVDAPVYAPKAGEVLIHVKATGICGYAARTKSPPSLMHTDKT